ncbi:MAG: hypothetical protein O3B95_06220 [Chloroflexi bacterium]|nr:hypothetical protein [Chloroflexota bacterium]
MPGSTSGATTLDPARTQDFINQRWIYTWTPVSLVIPASGQITLQFDVEGQPLPGTTFASSAIRIEEDEDANWLEPTSATGDTAPITAIRNYQITAVYNGENVTVVVSVSAGGIDIVSWTEQ